MRAVYKKGVRRLRHLVGAVRLVRQSAPGWTVLAAGAAVVQGALPAASLYLTKLVVDALTEVLAQPSSARDLGPVLILVPAVLAVMVVGGLCRALTNVANEAQSTAVSNHVQGVLHRKALEVDYQCFENPAFYDTMRMAHGEAASRPTRIVRNLTQSLRDLLSLLTVIGVLAASHTYLVPVVLLAVIPGTVVRLLNSRWWHAWRLEHMADERHASYLSLILTSAGFAKELRVFGHGPTLLKRFRRLRERLRASRLRLAHKRVGHQMAADAVSFLIAGAGLAVVVWRFRTGQAAFSMGDLALLFRAFQRAKGALAGWLSSLTALYEDAVFIEHFYEFMDLPQTVGWPASPRSLPASQRRRLEVTNLTFRYPGTDRDVLSQVSFRVEPGEHVAVVGENGAGKTTLAKLICRLYDPEAGRIAVDGIDIREIPIEELRATMGVLFQDYAHYFMAAGENIRMGNVALQPGDRAIDEAARLSGADAVIAGLPKGYDTLLGRMFEGGVELSTGQWQRLALARALVRDASFVLLDEHTSALDPKTEAAVLRQLFESVRGRTVLIISHRLSTVKMVDRVIVLRHGRIAEQGTHDELLRQGGVYAGLFLARGNRSPLCKRSKETELGGWEE